MRIAECAVELGEGIALSRLESLLDNEKDAKFVMNLGEWYYSIGWKFLAEASIERGKKIGNEMNNRVPLK